MLDVLLRFLHPLKQRITLLRGAKLIFVLVKFIVSEYDSFRFSLSFSASFWMVFVEPGAAPPVHAKINGTKLLCSTSRTRGFQPPFSMGVENFFTSKKVRPNRPPQSPFALISSRASSSVLVVL